MDPHRVSNGAAIAAIVANGSVMLVIEPERDEPYFKFPGGEIEHGETPLEAIIRELEEETGFEIPAWISLGSPAILDGYTVRIDAILSRTVGRPGNRHPQHFFVVEVSRIEELTHLDLKVRQGDAGETIKTHLMTLDTARNLPNFLPPQQVLLDALVAYLSESG